MSRGRRTALTVLLALALAAVGAVGGAVVHRSVIEPSDEELVALARDIGLDGVVATSDPAVAGAWAPSFDRGIVVWDASSDDARSGADVAADLEADGWTVDRVASRGAAEIVSASRGGVEVDVRVRESGSGKTDLTVSLARGDTTPSLAVTVALGAVVGALAGAAVAVAVQRRGRSSIRGSSLGTVPVA